MIADLIVNGEMVKVLDLILDDPLYQYSQTEISEGSGVSRPTVAKIMARLKQLDMILEARKFGKTVLYEVNRKSQIVQALINFDSELSNAMATLDLEDFDRVPQSEYLESANYDSYLVVDTRKIDIYDRSDVARGVDPKVLSLPFANPSAA
jgi:DNA-binding Lrp family transcriptional regulator